MSEKVELSDSTHSRLVKLMSPNDTTESAVLRLLDFYKEHAGDARAASLPSATPNGGERHFKGTKTPDLTFAKVTKAQIDGLGLPKANWNSILSHLAVTAFKKGVVDSFTGVIHGKKTDANYTFYPEANISMRGQAARYVWCRSVELADKLNADVVVECKWRDKAKAKLRGKKAVLESRLDTPWIFEADLARKGSSIPNEQNGSGVPISRDG